MNVPTLFPTPSETISGTLDDLLRPSSVVRRGSRRLPGPHRGVGAKGPRLGGRRSRRRPAQAKVLDEAMADGRDLGPLHGIPVGIKDIVDVRGLPTAAGTRRWGVDRVATDDAPIVARLRAAGAVILGKTVTTPYAWIDPPPTRNPWNLDRTPGGSSSGSAAAVVCGMVLGAIGSQTGGSITRPASFCGVAGLKPTFDRLPSQGIVPLAPGLDHPGPIAPTVPDLARMWHALAVPDSRDRPARPDGSPMRLGQPRGFFDDRVGPAMREALAGTVEWLRAAGIEVAEVDLPDGFAEEVPGHHRAILAAQAAAFHVARLAADPDDYPPRIRELIAEGRAIREDAYVRSRRHQETTRRAILGSFDGVDALITPAALGPAPDPSTTGDPLLNSPWSYTGLPTISFPVGLAPDGLPLAVQLVGRPFGEPDLLRLGARCEASARTQS